MPAPKPAPSLAARVVNGLLAVPMVLGGGWGAAWGLSRALDGVVVEAGEPPHAQVVFISALLALGGLYALFTAGRACPGSGWWRRPSTRAPGRPVGPGSSPSPGWSTSSG
jgi:hypothetical protein